MSQRLEYTPPPAPLPGAREELEALLQTLHSTGTLRFLNGFIGRLGDVNQVLVQEANSTPGRNLIGALLFAGECLAHVPPEELERLAQGLRRGVERAREVLRADPPGNFHLLRVLDDRETRRSIAAAVAFLTSVAAAHGREETKD